MSQNKQSMKYRFKLLFVSVVCVGMVSACASLPPKNDAFESAMRAYEEAKANSEVMANAPVAMHDAEKAMNDAKNAYLDGSENVTHLAYIAEKNVQIAIARTEQRIAEKQIDQLSKDKQSILIDTRQREADDAKQKAEQRAKQLEAKEQEIERKALELKAKSREIEMAREQARQLERELSDLQAKQTNRGIVLTIGDVLFQFAKADLLAGGKRSIDTVADFLRRYPNRKVMIEGHTDDIGSQEYNLKLSLLRAESVRSALMQKGIDPLRVKTKGFGKLFPVADNKTPTGQQANRRVEIIILDEGKEFD
jgi:outer membrane protein OmpA-like peptidoglycan-associated protein